MTILSLSDIKFRANSADNSSGSSPSGSISLSKIHFRSHSDPSSGGGGGDPSTGVFGSLVQEIGASSLPGDEIYLQSYLSTFTGDVNSGTMYIEAYAGFGDSYTKLLIYNDSGGAPSSFLGASDEINIIDGSSYAPYTFSFSTPVAVIYNIRYWIGAKTSFYIKYGQDDLTYLDLYYQAYGYYSGVPNPFVPDGNTSYPATAIQLSS